MKRGIKLLRKNLEMVFESQEEMAIKLGETLGIINLMLSDDMEIEDWFLEKIKEFIPNKDFEISKNLINLARKSDTSHTKTTEEIDEADKAEKEYYKIYPDIPKF